MAGKQKNDALIGVGKLERLAKGYAQASKTLLKLVKALRRLTDDVQAHPQAPEPRKVAKRPVAAHSNAKPKRKGMSAAAKRKLSEAMKARWAERKAEKAPKPAKANGKQASPNAA